MGLSYSIDHARNLVLTEGSGEIGLRDFLRHYDALAEDADFHEGLDRLTDLRGCTFSIQPNDVWQIAERISRDRLGNCRSAIVADDELGVALTRMYAILATNAGVQAEVFTTREDAMTWLLNADG